MGQEEIPLTESPQHGDTWDMAIGSRGDIHLAVADIHRAITVGMYRTKLDLLDFKPAAPTIRLRDVGGRSE